MTGPDLIRRAAGWRERTALAGAGGTATYGDLLDGSARGAATLLEGCADLGGRRVVFLVPPGIGHVVAQWAIWRAGGVAVPLSASQAPGEWDYVARDTQASVIVAGDGADRLREVAATLGVRFIDQSALAGSGEPAEWRFRCLPPRRPENGSTSLATRRRR
jgi:malonyl-CoA/methylmalonyl-CoA synthetase